MASTVPTRIDGELHSSAALVGDVMSRSATQQLNHWARIGREIEAAASVSQHEVAEVLSGRREYDRLNADEQAVVRAEWAERLNARIDALDLGSEFAREGLAYAELDDEGQVVVREPVVERSADTD